jgi:putative PIN family toxin of toxin-antitoxin system
LPVILDTNVVLSLWMFEDPALVRLRAAVESGALRPFSREDCLGELVRVLAYSQFALAPERQAEIAAVYRARCSLIEPVEPPACELPSCLDRDDQKFLELARDSGARALLTRDKLVLKLGRRPVIAARFAIITPERLQALLPPAQLTTPAATKINMP